MGFRACDFEVYRVIGIQSCRAYEKQEGLGLEGIWMICALHRQMRRFRHPAIKAMLMGLVQQGSSTQIR